VITFPKIGQFKQVVGNVLHRSGDMPPALRFLGTPKMHGTNASVVRYPDGRLAVQSRTREITPESDNAGFAAWIQSLGAEFWADALPASADPIAVFGEWIGAGINRGAGVCLLPTRTWVLFACRAGGGWANIPSKLKFPRASDFATYEIEIDFSNPAASQNALRELTAEVEAACPVASSLGDGGTGEGIVWTCVTPGWESSDYWFKVKGDKHSVSKVKTLREVDDAKLNRVAAFVAGVVTEARLEQGLQVLRESGKAIDERATGDFLRWVVHDILEEHAGDLAEYGLTPKDIGKPISMRARRWWFATLEAAS